MIKPLTSLRFFFALMVFMSHLNPFDIKDKTYQWLFSNIFVHGKQTIFSIISIFHIINNKSYKLLLF